MKTDEVIERLLRIQYVFASKLDIENGLALELAIKALKVQQSRQNPAPLTLEQLRGMEGKPVWYGGKGLIPLVVQVGTFENDMAVFYRFGSEMASFQSTYSYGHTWWCFAHEPKEAL